MLQGLAERRKQKGAVTWKHRPFINQARRDGLQLKHWVKCAKDATGQMREVNEGDYPFAKCNKQVRIWCPRNLDAQVSATTAA
jgi:hypothetical protein